MNLIPLIKNKSNILFIASIILFSIIVLPSTQNVGFSSDEIEQHSYGLRALKFYKTFGKDTSYMISDSGIQGWDGTDGIKSYGAGFYTLSAGVSKLFPNTLAYDVRHFISGLFGILLILFVGLICKSIMGINCGIIAIWMIFLSPVVTGMSLYDDKDLPFATCYVASIYYIISYIKNISNQKHWIIIGSIISMGFAIGMRVIGFFLPFYFVLFVTTKILIDKDLRGSLIKFNRRATNILLSIFVIGSGSYILGVSMYPYLLSTEHIARLLEIVLEMAKYPLKTPMLFDGERIWSTELPLVNYISTFLLYQTPVVTTIGIIFTVPLIIIKFKTINFRDNRYISIVILLFALVFPLSIIIYKNAVIYNHIRHILFIFPLISILSSISIFYFFRSFSSKYIKYPTMIILLFFGLKTAVWMVNANPNLYIYLNEISGGYSKAGPNFDRDYHHISARQCFNYMIKENNILNKNKKTLIISNTPWQIKKLAEHHFGEKAKNITVKYCGYNSYSNLAWDYAIMTDEFFPINVKETFFPTPHTIYSIDLDGVVLSCLAKNKDKLEYKGINLICDMKYSDGLKLLERSYSKNPNNISIYNWLAYGYSEVNNSEKAIKFFTLSEKYNISNETLFNWTYGNIQYQNKNYNEALKGFNWVLTNSKINDINLLYKIIICNKRINNKPEALKTLKLLLNIYPNDKVGLKLLKVFQKV